MISIYTNSLEIINFKINKLVKIINISTSNNMRAIDFNKKLQILIYVWDVKYKDYNIKFIKIPN